MTEWQATPELRFVKRYLNSDKSTDTLQQKWVRPGRDWEGCAVTKFEWRDVPIVEEG